MPALAGAALMPYRRFLFFNALGGIVWGTGCVLLGYLAGGLLPGDREVRRPRRGRTRRRRRHRPHRRVAGTEVACGEGPRRRRTTRSPKKPDSRRATARSPIRGPSVDTVEACLPWGPPPGRDASPESPPGCAATRSGSSVSSSCCCSGDGPSSGCSASSITILLSLFLGFAIEPIVDRLARRGWRRGLATLLVYAVIAIIVPGFIVLVGSLVVSQTTGLVKSGPDGLAQISQWLKDNYDVNLPTSSAEISKRISAAGPTIAGGALGFATSILGLVFQVFTVALLGFFFATEGPRFRRALCSRLPPARQLEVLRIWDLAIQKTAGFLYSRILLAAASAAAHGTFFAIIGLPYALTLGLFVGVVSQFIPTVGTYIAGALPILVALTISPQKALLVLGFVILYQQIENYVIAPPLSARTMELHPAIAFGGVIVGATLLGPAGAFLALPIIATGQAFFSSIITTHELVESEMFEDVPAPAGGRRGRCRRPRGRGRDARDEAERGKGRRGEVRRRRRGLRVRAEGRGGWGTYGPDVLSAGWRRPIVIPSVPVEVGHGRGVRRERLVRRGGHVGQGGRSARGPRRRSTLVSHVHRCVSARRQADHAGSSDAGRCREATYGLRLCRGRGGTRPRRPRVPDLGRGRP